MSVHYPPSVLAGDISVYEQGGSASGGSGPLYYLIGSALGGSAPINYLFGSALGGSVPYNLDNRTCLGQVRTFFYALELAETQVRILSA